VREDWLDSKTKGHVMANGYKSAAFLMDSWVADAARGDADALYELGVAYSTGTHGTEVDLVEAHKWFNLAALNGSEVGQNCRAEIAEEMTAREIAEAQRQARAWLSTSCRRAA
jgi:TPR repeat protein